VYQTTAAGALESIPPDEWKNSVTITPPGGGTAVNAAGYVFTAAGNHKVEVKALGMTGTYDLWVVAEYQPVIYILYVDGVTGTMKQNAQGEWVVTTPKKDMMIYSFITVNAQTGDPGQLYYMGRKDTDNVPIKLNISPDGTLGFRAPDAKGIPVGTVAEMQLINDPAAGGALGGTYYLETDLDLLGGNNVSGRLTWASIGKANPFTGVFDGNDKSLDNIYVDERTDGAGLFGYLSGSGALKNIHLKSGSVTGGGDDVGGIAGGQKPDNQHIRISNCSSAATVTGSGNSIGGIIGWPRGGAVITGCGNSGEVSGNGPVGGIAGGADANIIVIACSNTGEVSGKATVGGIIGKSGNNSFIIGCRNSGPIKGFGLYIGTEFLSTAGGITGGDDRGITITACYNRGSVWGGGKSIGGIAGTQGRGSMTACYNDGSVTGDPGSTFKGGIKGDGSAPVTACYWNNDPPTEAVDGTGWGGNAGMTGYSGSFPNVQVAGPEWEPGNGPGWDGAGTPPVGGWWKQSTLTGGRLPELWWE
jgi:hypothetical protein